MATKASSKSSDYVAGVIFLGSIAHEVLPTTFVLYASYRYGWGERAIGLSIATIGACSALVGALPTYESIGLAAPAALLASSATCGLAASRR